MGLPAAEYEAPREHRASVGTASHMCVVPVNDGGATVTTKTFYSDGGARASVERTLKENMHYSWYTRVRVLYSQCMFCPKAVFPKI